MILSGESCCATAPSRFKSLTVEFDQPAGRFLRYQPTTSSKALPLTMPLALPYVSVLPGTSYDMALKTAWFASRYRGRPVLS
jgi:hypothetical protein